MGTLMAIGSFDHHSRRASRARLGVEFRSWVIACRITAILLIVSGVACLVIESAIGWALIGWAALPAMAVIWYRGELKSVPVAKKGETIEDLLDSEILGHLKAQPSPQDIASAITQAVGGQFFSARFGLSGNFLQQIVSPDPNDTAAVWQEALSIRSQLGIQTITAGVLVTALTRQLPQKITLLGHLQLQDEDLLDGIRWYDRINKIVAAHQRASKHPGGIGRDWSFGWIPSLSRFGQNISEGMNGSGADLVELASHKEAVNYLVNALSGQGSRSLALVGAAGVGKTEAVFALADTLMDPRGQVPAHIRYHQVFLLNAASLISAAPGRGELESLVTNILGEAYQAKNIIVCLDDAQLFFEDGVGSVDMSAVLLPILQAGRLPIILTMDEQRYLQIAQRKPELANAINRISIQAANEAETMMVMQDKLITTEYRNKVTYMFQALRESYRLSERYIHDLAMPGRAVRLMEAAAQYAESGLVTAKSVQLAIEKTMNVKVGVADNDQERDKLLNLEAMIHERMIGQDKAVMVVSDALRRARAGVRNQARPIGTFLFLGPTGVGKTELAKSLAATYFGSEDQLVRLDMNEFVSPDDVRRLIADGAKDPGSLTARIMKQPFSVILLDEIEKAHSSVLTTLLQLLDEGILRDENNREVSFRDAIIVATSNAGADRIREYINRGYQLEQFEDQIVNELIDSKIFHAEFLNRFDEIVVFSPLNKVDLLQVVDLIIAGINKTLDVQKVSVTVADDAKQYLVDAGYDPRLGARPMRRIVQKTVENMVAKAMLSQQVQPGGVTEISLSDVQGVIEKSKTGNAIIEGSK